MKKKFSISRWKKTENGFVEIEPLTFEFGVCKHNGNLHYCVEGKVCMKITLGTLFTDNVNDMLLYGYKGVLEKEYIEDGKYLFLDEIKDISGSFYTDLLSKIVLADKKLNKRDRIVEIFGKYF